MIIKIKQGIPLNVPNGTSVVNQLIDDIVDPSGRENSFVSCVFDCPIFLQRGITFNRCLFKASIIIKGKELTPVYGDEIFISCVFSSSIKLKPEVPVDPRWFGFKHIAKPEDYLELKSYLEGLTVVSFEQSLVERHLYKFMERKHPDIFYNSSIINPSLFMCLKYNLISDILDDHISEVINRINMIIKRDIWSPRELNTILSINGPKDRD